MFNHLAGQKRPNDCRKLFIVNNNFSQLVAHGDFTDYIKNVSLMESDKQIIYIRIFCLPECLFLKFLI
jgi:hypothetical protein